MHWHRLEENSLLEVRNKSCRIRDNRLNLTQCSSLSGKFTFTMGGSSSKVVSSKEINKKDSVVLFVFYILRSFKS